MNQGVLYSTALGASPGERLPDALVNSLLAIAPLAFSEVREFADGIVNLALAFPSGFKRLRMAYTLHIERENGVSGVRRTPDSTY